MLPLDNRATIFTSLATMGIEFGPEAEATMADLELLGVAASAAVECVVDRVPIPDGLASALPLLAAITQAQSEV